MEYPVDPVGDDTITPSARMVVTKTPSTKSCSRAMEESLRWMTSSLRGWRVVWRTGSGAGAGRGGDGDGAGADVPDTAVSVPPRVMRALAAPTWLPWPGRPATCAGWPICTGVGAVAMATGDGSGGESDWGCEEDAEVGC
jgi:hypothetical protein